MYGMVNKALQDMVVSRHGRAVWEGIRRAAGVDVAWFVAMQSYPDEITYRLAVACGQVLEQPLERILEEFGEHWITFAADAGYGDLLAACGGSFAEFVSNLDNMHTRVGLQFPELAPPSFRCTEVTEDSCRIHYCSHRPALAPFVSGLLKGVGRRFGTEVSVRLDRGRSDGCDHDEFVVTFRGG